MAKETETNQAALPPIGADALLDVDWDALARDLTRLG